MKCFNVCVFFYRWNRKLGQSLIRYQILWRPTLKNRRCDTWTWFWLEDTNLILKGVRLSDGRLEMIYLFVGYIALWLARRLKTTAKGECRSLSIQSTTTRKPSKLKHEREIWRYAEKALTQCECLLLCTQRCVDPVGCFKWHPIRVVCCSLRVSLADMKQCPES